MDTITAPLLEPAAEQRSCPYVGPRPFEGRDKAFFFGREREAQELANMVAACPLTVVYGPSGAGKSSLLNATLLDELAKIEPDWIPAMFSAWQPGFEGGLLVTLADALGLSPTQLSLDRAAQALNEAARNSASPIILVLDQFEEYFLYHGAGAPQFEAMLAQLANRRSSAVHVVLSLRSDRLFLLDRLRRRIPHILQNLFLVDPLNAVGAADAIRKPIASYNRQHEAAVSVDDAVIDAVVRGADEQEIFQRLPFRGRGTAPSQACAATTQAVGRTAHGRIVAPFLQLALEALWREDVEVRGGTELTLTTLRVLAAAAPDAPSETLVGLLAQRHLDAILFSRSNTEQATCAALFDRMVTYSGGKVAVAVPGDFSSMFDADQLDVAAALLKELAVPGPNCLVRRVATDDQRLHEEAAASDDASFEIVHDALAVPILDWIRRWRARKARAEAEEREKAAAAKASREAAEQMAIERAEREARDARQAAKRRVWRFLWIAAMMIVVIVTIMMDYRERAETMARIAAFSRVDTQPEFRLRLLLGLASLSQADGPWKVLLKQKPVRDSLRDTLLRSPRYGGIYRSAGLDDTGTRLARLVNTGPGVARVQILTLDDGALKSIDAPADLAPNAVALRESVSAKLRSQRGPEVSMGFLAGMVDPVLVRRGILYYRTQAPAAGWRNLDIGQFLPPGFDDAPSIYVPVELTAGAVQITAISPSGNEMHVLRLRPVWMSDGTLQFQGPVSAVPVKWLGQRFQPALSPWLDDVPHERFAHLALPDAASPGQLTAPVLTVGDLSGETGEHVLWTGPAKLQADRLPQSDATSPTAPIPASVAFTDDGSAVAVRFGDHVRVLSLNDPPGAAKFHVPDSATAVSTGAGSLMRPLIAAVRVAPQSDRAARWRFAWLDSAGVVVLESDSDDNSELHAYRTWTGDATTLLSGLNGAFRLKFSRDGSFLILQQMQWPERMQQVRIWDLRPQWPETIRAARDDATLTKLACDRADIEPAGRTFRADERITWIGSAAPEPCAP